MKTWNKTCKTCGANFTGGRTARFCRECKKTTRRATVKRRASVVMNEKKCCSCGVVKPQVGFSKNRSGLGGLSDMCRQCTSAYRSSPRQKRLAREGNRRRYAENPAKFKKWFNAWRDENRDEWLSALRRRHAERRASDSLYAAKCAARTCVRNAFNRHGFPKSSKTEDILGCSWDHLLAHLASLCYGGMTAEDILANDGRVHIDHIIPLATAKTEEDVIRLSHYTNLQPLWAADNLEKSDRLDWVHPRDRA